jgi:hypothetical protein
VNLRSILASLPLLRRVWRWLPGPLRIPALLVGAVVWWFKRRSDDEAGGAGGTGQSTGGRTS